MQLRLQDALLIAVRAEAPRSVLRVYGWADAEALHSFRAEKRHVGRARAHRRQRRRIVDAPNGGLDRLVRLRIESPNDARRTREARRIAYLDRRVVHHFPHGVEEPVRILVL